MPGDYDLPDVSDDKSFIDAQRAAQAGNRPLKTSQSSLGEPRNSLTSYGLSDAMQGVALFKPPGIAYDAFNQELSKELEGLGTEELWKKRDDKLTPYDVFIKDPVARGQSGTGAVGTNAAASSGQNGEARAAAVGSGVPGQNGFVWPTKGVITSGVGPRWGSHHDGTDISTHTPDTGIYAAAPGTVINYQTGYGGGYGNHVTIDHGNGLTSLYGHMRDAPVVPLNTVVTQNQLLGIMGSTGHSTGVHLHFEIRINGAVQDPETFVGGAPEPG